MSQHLDTVLGPSMQTDVKTLAEEVVKPLREQIAEQSRKIGELEQRVQSSEQWIIRYNQAILQLVLFQGEKVGLFDSGPAHSLVETLKEEMALLVKSSPATSTSKQE